MHNPCYITLIVIFTQVALIAKAPYSIVNKVGWLHDRKFKIQKDNILHKIIGGTPGFAKRLVVYYYSGADLGLSGPGPEQINYIMKFIIKINEIHISERPWVNKDSLTSPFYP